MWRVLAEVVDEQILVQKTAQSLFVIRKTRLVGRQTTYRSRHQRNRNVRYNLCDADLSGRPSWSVYYKYHFGYF